MFNIFTINKKLKNLRKEYEVLLVKEQEHKDNTIFFWCKKAYDNAINKGFYDKEVNLGERVALIHSECSELLECLRKKSPPYNKFEFDANGKILNVPEELADICLRTFDLAGYLKIDLQKAINHKHHYNLLRPKLHGKLF